MSHPIRTFSPAIFSVNCTAPEVILLQECRVLEIVV